MKAIEFELDYTLPETGYYCTCCKHTEIDHSGKYVPASDYEALEAKLARLVEVANGILEIGKRDMSNSKYDGYFEELKAAIEAAKEDK